MTEQPQDNTEEISYGETGRRLKAAREKAGLDLQTLADQLHLRPVIVRAIEEGDYGSVPSELFLKGYVRSYARHIGISDDEMIQLLTRELAPEKESEEEEYASARLPAQDSRRRKQKMSLLGLALVVLVLLLLPFIWPGSDAPETGEAAPETQQPDQHSEQPGQSDPSERNLDSDASSPEGSGTDVAPALSEVETLAPSPEPSPEPPEESSQTVDPVSPQPPQADPGPDTEAEPEPESAPTDSLTAADQAQLQIRFTDDCWVEVVNGNGRTVVARLATAGDRVSYQGPGPLNVLLGAVSAVERLDFMGQPLDLSQYPARAGRTRFQLAVSDFVSDQD